MVSQNAINNTVTDNNFTVVHNDPTIAFASVQNTNAGAGADAAHFVGISATSHAAYDVHNVVGSATKYWADGVLQSDGAWYLHQSSAAFPTNPIMKATTTGAVTKPLQPAFLASLTVSAANATGAGATYTLSNASGGTLTEVFDQGSNFNPATGTFTAPVTGKYFFHCRFSLDNLTLANSGCACVILTAGGVAQAVQGGVLNPGVVADVSGFLGLVSASAFIDLTAGDTVTALISVSGGAGNTVNITGQALNNYLSYFEGYLVC